MKLGQLAMSIQNKTAIF